MLAQAKRRVHCAWQALPSAAGPAAQGRIAMRSSVLACSAPWLTGATPGRLRRSWRHAAPRCGHSPKRAALYTLRQQHDLLVATLALPRRQVASARRVCQSNAIAAGMQHRQHPASCV